MNRIELIYEHQIFFCAFILLCLYVSLSGCSGEDETKRQQLSKNSPRVTVTDPQPLIISRESSRPKQGYDSSATNDYYEKEISDRAKMEKARSGTSKERLKHEKIESLKYLRNGESEVMYGLPAPKAHLMSYLYEIGKEPHSYAMYTYVLINQSNADSVAWDKYKILVETIRASTCEVKDDNISINRSLYNLFLVPYTKGIGNLNDILSKSILSKIAAHISNQTLRESITTTPGPFLISVIEPIRFEQTYEDIDLLYVNLTRTNVAAMPEVVAAYKKRMTANSVEGVERLVSIRLDLLSIILNIDDYVNIVKLAYASFNK